MLDEKKRLSSSCRGSVEYFKCIKTQATALLSGCDTTNNFVLLSRQGNNHLSKSNRPGLQN